MLRPLLVFFAPLHAPLLGSLIFSVFKNNQSSKQSINQLKSKNAMETCTGKISRQAFTPTESTIYYYPLNGDLKDYSLNHLPNAVNNGCPFVQDSAVGKMIKFESAAQHFLTLPQRTTYLSNLMDRTISYILYVDNIFAEKQAIFNLGPHVGYGQTCEISLNSIFTGYDGATPVKPCIAVSTRGSQSDYSTQMNFRSHQPILVTHTIKNADNNLKTYVNGRIVNDVYLYERGVSFANADIFLGRGFGGGNFYSDLGLAEFILEGRVWKDVEIADYARSLGF